MSFSIIIIFELEKPVLLSSCLYLRYFSIIPLFKKYHGLRARLQTLWAIIDQWLRKWVPIALHQLTDGLGCLHRVIFKDFQRGRGFEGGLEVWRKNVFFCIRSCKWLTAGTFYTGSPAGINRIRLVWENPPLSPRNDVTATTQQQKHID